MSLKPLILLHGALGSRRQMDGLIQFLDPFYDCFSIDFSGHGGKSLDGMFHTDRFAKEVQTFIQDQQLERPAVFGYSMGGYVALWLAGHLKVSLSGIFTLATKFDWTPESAAKELKMLNPAAIEEKVPKFAAALEKRHAPTDWKAVLQATGDMMVGLGNGDGRLTEEALGSISCPCRIHVGSADKMVSEAESQQAANQIPGAGFVQIPDARHPIEQVDQEDLARRIREFFG